MLLPLVIIGGFTDFPKLYFKMLLTGMLRFASANKFLEITTTKYFKYARKRRIRRDESQAEYLRRQELCGSFRTVFTLW